MFTLEELFNNLYVGDIIAANDCKFVVRRRISIDDLECNGLSWNGDPFTFSRTGIKDIDKVWRNGFVTYVRAEPVALSNTFDPVSKPKHYADKPIETIDVLKNELSPEEFKGFLRGNVLKYVSRYQKKAGVQDLEKAQWYLTKLIEEEKK